MQHYELEARVEQLEAAIGTGTELVTLTIPPEKELQPVRRRIDGEYADAENIKSDRTRDRVRDALGRVRRLLREYDETPENGLIVYAGVVDGELIGVTFDDLPAPVASSQYTCSSSFETAPLRALISPSVTYGLIVIERGGAAFGTHHGERVLPITTIESQIMGKTRAGGQSAQRFARERERQKHEFFTQIGEIAKREFLGDEPVSGLLIGGTTVTVASFRDGDYLDHRLRDAVLGSRTVEHASERGLEQLAERGAELLLDADRRAARNAVDGFFEGLATETPVTYGREEVGSALELGAVDTLIVSSSLSTNRITDLRSRAEEFGSTTVVVSTDFERGERIVSAFGGVCALLRFPVN